MSFIVSNECVMCFYFPNNGHYYNNNGDAVIFCFLSCCTAGLQQIPIMFSFWHSPMYLYLLSLENFSVSLATPCTLKKALHIHNQVGTFTIYLKVNAAGLSGTTGNYYVIEWTWWTYYLDSQIAPGNDLIRYY